MFPQIVTYEGKDVFDLEWDYNQCMLLKYGENTGGIMIWGWNLGLLLALVSFRDNLLPHIFYVITT